MLFLYSEPQWTPEEAESHPFWASMIGFWWAMILFFKYQDSIVDS